MADNGVPPANGDAAAMWKYLEEGIDEIMVKAPDNPAYVKYMSLYTVAYNYCTSGGDEQVRHRHGQDIYNNLVRYFATHSKGLCEASDALQDEALLTYYGQQWDRYTTAMNYINRLFTYINRHWVKAERVKGHSYVYPVYTLALVQWRTNFFFHLQSQDRKLSDVILRLIERQRNGEQIDEELVKKVVCSFVSLGFNQDDLAKVSYEVYKEHFEQPFLEATAEHYRQESTTFLVGNSVSEYLRKAEERLGEEEDRVTRYLNAVTREELIRTCEQVLVREHSARLLESFQELLDHDKDEDLQRMYSLFVRIPEVLGPFREKFEEHVKRAGQSTVAKLMDGGAEVDPNAYVDKLLEIRNKYAQTVARNFKGEAGFLASLDKVYRELAKDRLLEEEYVKLVESSRGT